MSALCPPSRSGESALDGEIRALVWANVGGDDNYEATVRKVRALIDAQRNRVAAKLRRMADEIGPNVQGPAALRIAATSIESEEV